MSFLGTNYSTVQPSVYNMYGQGNTPNTGAITSMQSIFDALNNGGLSNATNSANAFANRLQGAANNPAFGSIYNYGLNELNGNYLQSPLVSNYANQAYQSQLGAGQDAAARQRAQMSRAGMGFSTANQQATDADIASAAQKGALSRGQILTQNEEFERQQQQNAPGIISGAVSQPLSYLSGVNNALYAPYQSQAGVTQQLAGGATIGYPTMVQQPNQLQSILGGLTGAGSIYNLLGGTGGTAGLMSAAGGGIADMLSSFLPDLLAF